eukprot:EG_transcript_19170
MSPLQLSWESPDASPAAAQNLPHGVVDDFFRGWRSPSTPERDCAAAAEDDGGCDALDLLLSSFSDLHTASSDDGPHSPFERADRILTAEPVFIWPGVADE